MILSRYSHQRIFLLVTFGSLLGLCSYVFLYFPSPSTYTVPQSSSIQHTITAPTTPTTPIDTKILLVSSFFPLAKSKHSIEDYTLWFSKFLAPISTEIYFYTSPEWADHIRGLRGDLPISINTTFISPFDIPPLSGLREKYTEMHKLDREKKIHGPELYSVWNAKAYFLDEAIRNTNTKWDYVFWNDAGSFRDGHEYKTWPDPLRVNQLWEEGSRLSGTPQQDLIFFPTANSPSSWSFKNWKESKGPIDTDFSEGSFFGGSPKAVSWYRRIFYAYHDYYLSLGYFVGKDQTVFNAIIFLFPSRFITVWLSDPYSSKHIPGLPPLFSSRHLGHCGGEWFYYQFWLAGAEEQEHMRTRWNTEAGAKEVEGLQSKQRGKWDNWASNGDLTCRLADELTMLDLLRKVFGKGWKPPVASIDASR